MNDILKPSVYMVAGCNGAGKTTAIMTLLPDYLNICNFLNADEIARGLSPLNPQSAVIDAGRLMLQQLDKIILQKKDFAFETTASGLGHIKTLKKCLSAGYKIHIIYLYLHCDDIAIKRVANRVSQGGHYVAQQDIKRRYIKGLRRILYDYAPLAHFTQLIDNSYGLMQNIASKTNNNNWNVQNKSLWNNIQHKVNYDR